MKRLISVLIPTYNDESSIEEIYSTLTATFSRDLSEYDYTILFADDYSSDGSRTIIRRLADRDPKHVRAIFNKANFGMLRNVFNAFRYSSGDATFLCFGDMQDPPELIKQFVEIWQTGGAMRSQVVIGRKKSSMEDMKTRFFRNMYYHVIDLFSDKNQIKQFNGFGLYDRSFVDILNSIDDIQPYLKQVVAEYCPDYKVVEYSQNCSKRGISNYNFYRNYDFAMEGIISSSKKLMRMSTFIGSTLGILSLIYAISVVIKKLMFWDSYPMGIAALTVGMFLLGSIQLFFIGILGEYILNVRNQGLKRPRVVVDELLGFKSEKDLLDKDK